MYIVRHFKRRFSFKNQVAEGITEASRKPTPTPNQSGMGRR